MRLRYTTEAVRELDDVLTSIAERSPRGALRIQARIRQAVDLLADHPRGGQATDRPGLRRIATTPFPYLIFYEVRPDEVVVIGIRHAARDPASRSG